MRSSEDAETAAVETAGASEHWAVSTARTIGERIWTGEPRAGHPDLTEELAPGVAVHSRWLPGGLCCSKLVPDRTGSYGFGLNWKESVTDLLRAVRDFETWEEQTT